MQIVHMSLPSFKGFILDEPNLYVESNLPYFFENTWALHFLYAVNKSLDRLYKDLKLLHPKLYNRINYTPQVKKLEKYLPHFFINSGVDIDRVAIDPYNSKVFYSNVSYSNKAWAYPRTILNENPTITIRVFHKTSATPTVAQKKDFNTFCRINIPVDRKYNIIYVTV